MTGDTNGVAAVILALDAESEDFVGGTPMYENAANLIPELADWNGGEGIGLGAWLGCIGRYDHAAAYAACFWPDFVRHDPRLRRCPLARL